MLPTKKNWAKIGALLTFLGIIVGLLVAVISLAGQDEALKYFGITIVLFFSMFVYFEWIKEYPSARTSRH